MKHAETYYVVSVADATKRALQQAMKRKVTPETWDVTLKNIEKYGIESSEVHLVPTSMAELKDLLRASLRYEQQKLSK